MIKKCYRFFGNRTARQQKWLNAMSHEGYRLIGTARKSLPNAVGAEIFSCGGQDSCKQGGFLLKYQSE